MQKKASLLIQNGQVVDPSQNMDQQADVLIVDGVVKQVGENISAGDVPVFDATGKVVVPGFVDMHVHLREPGFEHKEDIETGTAAAAAGGFTSVACMPNTDPVIDNSGIVDLILSRAQAVGMVNVFPIGAATRQMKSEEIANIGSLVAAGAVAISDDAFPIQNNYVMRKVLEYINMFDVCFISHPEDNDLSAGGVMNEGFYSTALGLKGIPGASEEVIVARNILLSRLTGAPVHMAHISCAESVKLIQEAKQDGVRVTAETGPHYFTLTDESLKSYDTNFKMNPPLRTDYDREVILQAVREGVIDAIATDHAPHLDEEKLVEFNYAPFGIVGLETVVGVVLTTLYHDYSMPLTDLVKRLSTAPAQILRINKGTLAPGADGDVTVLDLNRKWTVDAAAFKSKSRNTPYKGYELTGKAVATIVAGDIVYQD